LEMISLGDWMFYLIEVSEITWALDCELDCGLNSALNNKLDIWTRISIAKDLMQITQPKV